MKEKLRMNFNLIFFLSEKRKEFSNKDVTIEKMRAKRIQAIVILIITNITFN